MHEVASTVGPTLVILIGIAFGILYGQRATDKVEARIDRLEKHFETRIDRLESHFDTRITRLETHVDARLDRIQSDLIIFHRNLGQHDKALEILGKARQLISSRAT